MYCQLKLKYSKYFEINNLKDLNKLKFLEEVLNIKVNYSKIAKHLGVDRKTIKKYYGG